MANGTTPPLPNGTPPRELPNVTPENTPSSNPNYNPGYDNPWVIPVKRTPMIPHRGPVPPGVGRPSRGK